MKEQKQSAWDFIFATIKFILWLPIILPYIVISSLPIAWTLANLFVDNEEAK